jgi:hypothetical protein
MASICPPRGAVSRGTAQRHYETTAAQAVGPFGRWALGQQAILPRSPSESTNRPGDSIDREPNLSCCPWRPDYCGGRYWWAGWGPGKTKKGDKRDISDQTDWRAKWEMAAWIMDANCLIEVASCADGRNWRIVLFYGRIRFSTHNWLINKTPDSMLGSYLNSDFKAFLSAYRHTGLDDLHVCASSPVIELLLRVCFNIIILFAFLYL